MSDVAKLQINTGIMVFLILMYVAPFVLLLIDKFMHTQLSCDTFGWHNGKGKSGGDSFDGCSFHAKCSKCTKEVMQDSQGNWF